MPDNSQRNKFFFCITQILFKLSPSVQSPCLHNYMQHYTTTTVQYYEITHGELYNVQWLLPFRFTVFFNIMDGMKKV